MEDEYTSGPWTGFYTYATGAREKMDLSLTFREGIVSGAVCEVVVDDIWHGAEHPSRPRSR